MKNVRLVLATMAIAIGAGTVVAVNSAFKKADSVDTYYYGNNGDGTYRLLQNAPNPNSCSDDDDLPCTISSSEEIPGGFAWGAKPADAVASPSTAVYTGM